MSSIFFNSIDKKEVIKIVSGMTIGSSNPIVAKLTDVRGLLYYNGSPIAVPPGITNLNDFTTADLADSLNKRYVTDSDLSNIHNLSSVISSQGTVNNTLSTINSYIPSGVSSSNKLITDSTLTSKLNSLSLFNLSNVDRTVQPNAFLITDSTGTNITYKTSILSTIQKITDKNNAIFSNVAYLKFNSLTGTLDTDGTLELNPSDLYSTDLLDMPKDFLDNTVLVANQSLMKYELKKISDLTNSKENFTATINQTDWLQDVAQNIYTYTIKHNLNSENLIIDIYDSANKVIKDISWTITDVNDVMFNAPTNDTARVIINCSQGAVGSGTGTSSSFYVTASDFIDDTRIRDDKTYSSQNITSILKSQYASIGNVYTKPQCDSLFASQSSAHIHLNLSTLNKISEDSNGNMFFDGKKILTNLQPFSYQNTWTDTVNTDLSLVVDVNNIFITKNYNMIVNSELSIKNNIACVDKDTDIKIENQLHLVVIDNNLTVLDVLIEPQSTQKYVLGISPNLKILIKGSFTANFYLTAY